jgi:hypothetical protein
LGREEQENGQMLFKGEITFRDILHSIVIIVNNVLYISKFLKDFKCPHHRKR